MCYDFATKEILTVKVCVPENYNWGLQFSKKVL